MDEKAIVYASILNKHYLDKIAFIQKNVFRFNTEYKFNMIWSARLFDYFDDKAFIILLKKIKGWIGDSGEIIVGNFNANHNPSRAYMEFFGNGI